MTEKLHRVYLAVALLLVIPDTFYWYSLNDYISYKNAFNAITGSTGLTWLLVSYLALFFAIVAQKLEMRAFLTVVALVTRFYFLVWISDIWRSNQVSFPTLLKNVFIRTNSAPYIELFALIALIPLVLSLVIQRTRVANFLTALINFLRQPTNRSHRIGFQIIAAVAFVSSTYIMVKTLIDYYNVTRGDMQSGFKTTLVWLLVLGVISIALKLLILTLGLIALLWAWISWKQDFQLVLGNLKDFKLSEYLTRKVASYLYTFYFVVIVALVAVGTPIFAAT
ncbi:MAG: hypothetical protein EBS18_04450, partial [Actinobacteria bacterium]|nr:hypothetical protein [Actinomycetota bacterium]